MKTAYVFFGVIICVVPAFSGTLETSSGFDGAMGIRGYGIYSERNFSCGVSFRRKADGVLEAMGGLNSPFLIAGHLGDRGLAAEARNPEASAMGRIGEKTGYRADLRSYSDSRFGICANLPGERLGIVWEKRAEEQFVLLWAVPVSSGAWTWELLHSAALLQSSEMEEAWYPDCAERSGGLFFSAASRFAYRPKKWDFTATVLASGSPHFRPGSAAAASMRYSSGPWRLRTRLFFATAYFRNADGERTHGPWGAAMDMKYASLSGLLFGIDYEYRLDSGFSAPSVFEDKGGCSLGWRFPKWRIKTSVDWNALAVRGAEDDGLFNLKQVELKGEYNASLIFFELGLGFKPTGFWSAALGVTYSPSSVWKISADAEMECGEGFLRTDVGLDWKLKKDSHVFLVSLDFKDLTNDWKDGPQNTECLDVSLRWILDFQ